ncbi:protein of unknown function [Candidatus Bipolaricaulis anaerobius]|uniref:Uncharacterized protein n=1 Tax=Candidatus Bipolaricaulis anaerobius TaxID=2026885 RepID=A0A2X3MJK4_9BACT|nr:protein of unknown function [Candidatus Bipolaricaulis anaerobius]
MPPHRSTKGLPLGGNILTHKLVAHRRVIPTAGRHFAGPLAKLSNIVEEAGQRCPSSEMTLVRSH